MNLTLQIAKGPREIFAWLFCFVGLPFALGQLFIDIRYNTYREEYHITQQEETRVANAKIAGTYSLLKDLAHDTGQFIHADGKDLPAIPKSLQAAMLPSSQHYDTSAFFPQSLMYYKLTGQPALITPAWIAPLASLPVDWNKPSSRLPSFAFHYNELVETVPVIAQDNQLAGVLEFKVPSIALQKFVGADRLTTLSFPPLFDKDGRALLQKDPLAFSLLPPLSRTNYFLSHKDYFWGLTYAIVIGVGFLFLFQRIFKERASLAFAKKFHLKKVPPVELPEKEASIGVGRENLPTPILFICFSYADGLLAALELSALPPKDSPISFSNLVIMSCCFVIISCCDLTSASISPRPFSL